MVAVGLALLLAMQNPQVEASVSHDEIAVGGEVVVTVKVLSSGGALTEPEVPSMVGFDLMGTSQSSVFRADGLGGVRETTWTYRLRAAEPGRAVIGSIRVRVGSDILSAGELTVLINAVGDRSERGFSSRVAEIVDGAPGPGNQRDVTVTVVPSRDTVVLGEQLDLVVVAWFPRDIRDRLRTRPTLTPPELKGAWIYPRTSTLGISDTREIDGRLYDLFVHHQVAFPLVSGELQVGRATVEYSLPLRTSILSRELPQEVQSEGLSIVVLPQPAAARPPAYSGAAADGLQFTVSVDSGDFGVGSTGTVVATVSGRGNVALWPEPVVLWPEGVRVYPGLSETEIEVVDGYVGGTKTFSYLVTPDSAGSYNVPPPAYAYFDLASGRFVEAVAPAFRLVASGVRSTTSSVSPPPLMMVNGVSWIDRLVSNVRLWHLILLILVPPLLVSSIRLFGKFTSRRGSSARMGTDLTLRGLQREFRAKLELLVPEIAAREGDGLPAALRAAGVEVPVAVHAWRVRDRLRQAVYGPQGSTDATELAEEVREVLRALPGSPFGETRRSGVLAGALLAGIMIPGILSAQTADQLFEAGAYRLAADSFQSRAVAESGNASHWFNTGAARIGSGDAVRARIAWTKAARISPRDRSIRAALRSVSVGDPYTQATLWVAPVTVAELAVIAVLLWSAGWLVYGAGTGAGAGAGAARRVYATLALCCMAIILGGFAGLLSWRYERPIALVSGTTTLREAPYGSAPADVRLGDGVAVMIEREEGAWLMVSHGERLGWVTMREVARF